MREIKFRGKRLDNGEWAYGDLIQNPENTSIYWTEPYCGTWQDKKVKVDPETVGQFTGLEDKNGVEIWEGDIVKWENMMKTPMRSVIRYIYNGFKFTDFDGEDQEIWCGVFEIIGNIHDNPELAKGGEK